MQGRIACANVLSDMYALGVIDVDNVLMLIAASTEMEPEHRIIVTQRMMQGFNGQIHAEHFHCGLFHQLQNDITMTLVPQSLLIILITIFCEYRFGDRGRISRDGQCLRLAFCLSLAA